MQWYENVVNVCMGVQPGECVLLITDEALRYEQEMLAKTIEQANPGKLLRWTLPEDQRPLLTAPPEILEAARTFDVGLQFLARTTTEEQPFRLALLKAVAEGAHCRYASGLNIDQRIMQNELSANYEEVAEITYKLRDRLQGKDHVQITSSLGTDLKLSIAGRQIAVDPGIIRTPGFNNLPSGECYVAPIETSASGILVIDKSFPGILIKDPITLIFDKGRAVDIKGGKEADRLMRQIKEAEAKPQGEGVRTIAELGIGTNPVARITGNIMTDEKVLGTIHVAIGHNAVAPYNGQNRAPIHLDGVMGNPTLTIDGEMLIDQGRYLV
jgi:leucyl aminopeptidase (aminopeptidase T)